MRITLIIILFSISSPGWANDVEAFLQSYVNSYTDYLNSGDEKHIAQVTEHFNKPLLQVPGTSEPFVAPDEAAVARNIGGFMSRIREAGVRKIEWEKINFAELGKSKAISSNVARLLDENGKLVRKSAGLYALYRYQNGWRIIMIQSIDESQVLDLN